MTRLTLGQCHPEHVIDSMPVAPPCDTVPFI